MATKERKLIYKLEAENAKYMRKMEQSEKRLKRYAGQTKRQTDAIKRAFADMGRKIAAALTITGGVAALRQITRITDQYTLLRGRLRLVTDSEAELVKVEKALFDSAQRTRSEYSKTVELYARVARNAESLGLSQQQLLQLTETTNQAIQISGASTAEAAGGVIQFSQAMASGELRGEELRSVMENMPRLAEAIADGLETDIGGLRKLAEQGELTAERVTQAMLGQAALIESEFGQLDRTVGQALTQLSNETARAFSGTDVQPLIDSVDEFRELVSDPQMVESLATLAAALVSVAGGAANFASELAGMGDQVAVNLAKIGGNLTPLDELEQQIKDVERAIKGGLNTPIGYLFTDDAELQEIRESLLAQKRLLEEQQSLSITGRTSIEPITVTAQRIGQPEVPAVDMPDPAAAKALDDAYKALLKTLEGMRSPQEVFAQQVAAADELLTAGKITQDEYNQALVAYKIELDEATGLNAQHQADLKKAAELTAAAVPPLVRMVQEIEELQRLQEDGLISQETYDATLNGMQALADKTADVTDEMSVFADEAARNMQGAFADFLYDPFEDGLKGMLRSFGDMLKRMAAEAAAAEVFDWIKDLGNSTSGSGSSGSSGGTDWMALIGTFAGMFDKGGMIPAGQFGMVGEQGPELISGPAHVISREDTAASMSGINVNMGNVNITANNEREGRLAAGEVARRVSKAVSGARRYS